MHYKNIYFLTFCVNVPMLFQVSVAYPKIHKYLKDKFTYENM